MATIEKIKKVDEEILLHLEAIQDPNISISDALHHLKAIVEYKDQNVRREAFPKALPILERALKDSDPLVRKEALLVWEVALVHLYEDLWDFYRAAESPYEDVKTIVQEFQQLPIRGEIRQ